MVRADHRRLQQLQKGIRDIASDAWKRALFNELGDATLGLVQDEFAKEMDPYGKAWRPLAYRKGKILDKTGRLRGSFRKQVNDSGFAIVTSVYYARFHQGPDGKGRDQLKAAVSRARRAFSKGHKDAEAGAESLDALMRAKSRMESRRAFLPYAGTPKTWMQLYRQIARDHRDRALGGA